MFGSFQRSIELPPEVDAEKIAAAYKDGVLEVTVAKSERAKSKQIRWKLSNFKASRSRDKLCGIAGFFPASPSKKNRK